MGKNQRTIKDFENELNKAIEEHKSKAEQQDKDIDKAEQEIVRLTECCRKDAVKQDSKAYADHAMQLAYNKAVIEGLQGPEHFAVMGPAEFGLFSKGLTTCIEMYLLERCEAVEKLLLQAKAHLDDMSAYIEQCHPIVNAANYSIGMENGKAPDGYTLAEMPETYYIHRMRKVFPDDTAEPSTLLGACSKAIEELSN